MLEVKDEYGKLVHKGHPLDVGIVKFKRYGKIIVEVNKDKASYKGKRWSLMTEQERDHLDDLLYLSNIQEADTRIIYV